jgi:hypothetical protein
MYDRFNTKHMKWIDDDLKLPEVQLLRFCYQHPNVQRKIAEADQKNLLKRFLNALNKGKLIQFYRNIVQNKCV